MSEIKQSDYDRSDNIKPIENDINEAESAIKKIKNTIKQLTSSLDKKESKL